MIPKTTKGLTRKWVKTGKIQWVKGFWADFDIKSGWVPLVDNLIEGCLKAGWNGEICQVKQKFGGLRFYINSAPGKVFDLIEKAEKKSFKVCEMCGGRSTTQVIPNPKWGPTSYNVRTQAVTKMSWIMALCKTCAKKKGATIDDLFQEKVGNVTSVGVKQ